MWSDLVALVSGCRTVGIMSHMMPYSTRYAVILPRGLCMQIII